MVFRVAVSCFPCESATKLPVLAVPSFPWLSWMALIGHTSLAPSISSEREMTLEMGHACPLGPAWVTLAPARW